MTPPATDHQSPATVLRLLVLDVDGVLTDGALYLDERGGEIKRFHVRDGLGIKAAREAGIEVAVLTSRSSRAVTMRMAEVGVTLVTQKAADKLAGLEALLERAGVAANQAAYMGDDLQDLPAMRRCAYKLAPADAAAEVRQAADHVTDRPGGHGAVREAVEHLLKGRGQWESFLQRYESS